MYVYIFIEKLPRFSILNIIICVLMEKTFKSFYGKKAENPVSYKIFEMRFKCYIKE